MISTVMAAIGVAMLVLAIVAARCCDRAPLLAGAVTLVSVGLAYDNLAVALGPILGFGDLLHAINVPRFWLHVFLLPVLILVGGALAARLGVGYSRSRVTAAVGGATALALVAVGVVEELAPLTLVASDAGGAIRYVNEAMAGTPPIPAIVTIAILLVLGALTWRAARWPWLFAGAAAMLAAASVRGVLWISNLGELALQLGIVVTLVRVTRRSDAEPESRVDDPWIGVRS